MPFHVIELETGQPYCAIIGQPQIFETGQEAATFARGLSQLRGKKHQPRAVTSDEWRQREQARFDSGHYQRLPWHDAEWFKGTIGELEHFAHVSTERDGMIAFTESPEKGAADRQTRQKPGTYLQRFYSDKLSAEEIQELARDYVKRFEDNALLLADTADEIERIYVEGPRSCMSSRADDYNSPFHPVRVYAAGDLAVAYVMHGGHIAGRSLCWPKQKQHSRIYGDDDRLKPLLVAAGYREGTLRGARLMRHAYKDGFVCPYIDSVYNVDDRGDFLHIGGDIPADSTNGVIDCEEQGEYCPHCETHSDPDSFCHIQDVEEYWCEDCANDAVYLCARTGIRYAHRRNIVQMANGDYWSVNEFENHGFTCEATGENYHMDDSVHMDSLNEIWCSDHFERNGFQCRGCHECFANEDSSHAADLYCNDCAPVPEEDGAAPSSPNHIARQGRNESPSQIEMTLALAPVPAFRVGDIVQLANTERAREIVQWRRANRFPTWHSNITFRIVVVHDNGNIDIRHSELTRSLDNGNAETWEPAGFCHAYSGSTLNVESV